MLARISNYSNPDQVINVNSAVWKSFPIQVTQSPWWTLPLALPLLPFCVVNRVHLSCAYCWHSWHYFECALKFCFNFYGQFPGGTTLPVSTCSILTFPSQCCSRALHSPLSSRAALRSASSTAQIRIFMKLLHFAEKWGTRKKGSGISN